MRIEPSSNFTNNLSPEAQGENWAANSIQIGVGFGTISFLLGCIQIKSQTLIFQTAPLLMQLCLILAAISSISRQIIREQDEGLDKLEETVMSTKHIALAVNEELDLHTGLINNLDQHVDVTDSRLRRVQKNLAVLNKRTKGGCTCMCMLLSVVGIAVLVIDIYLLIKYL